jgi:hypothetical protein
MGKPAPLKIGSSSVLMACVLTVVGLLGSLGGTGAAAAAAHRPSQAATAPGADGVLTGNVTIRNAPAYFAGEVGVAACPGASTPAATTGLCAAPLIAVAESGASYTLALPAGTWEVYEFYELGFEGGAYIGHAHTVSIVGGGTVRQNISVLYQAPTTLSGTVTVSGVPSGITVEALVVTACPSSQPLVGGIPSEFCDSDYVQGSDTYSLPTLFRGSWLLYVGYETVFGLTFVTTPTPVRLPKGGSVNENLSVNYQTPVDGALEGTVTITGAPPGFTAPFEGVGACPVAGTPGTACAEPSYTLIGTGDTYQLALTPGQWGAAGFYELGGFAGQFISPVQAVTVSAGVVDQVNFVIPYVKPAKVEATVTVTGVPAGVTVEGTELLACPSGDPYDGTSVPIECVEGSDAGSVVTIGTLPPGTWLLYPGYFASNGSFYTGTQGTTVKLRAGGTKKVSLNVAYQSG